MAVMANPAPRKLRMTHYDYDDDRGRSRGWRRIVDGGSGGYGNDGDGGNGNSSGGGGDGRRKVWEWKGRRVVLQVFPTGTTPATLETPTPAEPDGGEFGRAHTPSIHTSLLTGFFGQSVLVLRLTRVWFTGS